MSHCFFILLYTHTVYTICELNYPSWGQYCSKAVCFLTPYMHTWTSSKLYRPVQPSLPRVQMWMLLQCPAPGIQLSPSLQTKVTTSLWSLFSDVVHMLTSKTRRETPPCGLPVMVRTAMQVYCSLVPRPSLAPVFDHLQYAKTEPDGLVNLTTWFAAQLTSQILDMETYSHLYLQLQISWRNKTSSSRKTSPTSKTVPSLKQNRWRMVPLQALQIQKRLLFRYVS